jgi:hypothetical protein
MSDGLTALLRRIDHDFLNNFYILLKVTGGIGVNGVNVFDRLLSRCLTCAERKDWAKPSSRPYPALKNLRVAEQLLEAAWLCPLNPSLTAGPSL